jgi:alpha-beta hydrolase superfamily lysophospholipase
MTSNHSGAPFARFALQEDTLMNLCFGSRWRRLIVVASSAVLTVACALPVASLAQRPTKGAAGDNADAKKGEGKKEAKPAQQAGPKSDQPEPVAVELDTDDGVLIAATYFPSRAGKNAPAVILMHGYGEKQSVFWPSRTGKDLAFALQDAGYAVLTFDFRGHGRSVQLARGAEPQKGKEVRLNFKDMKAPQHFESMMHDIEAAKRFLVRKNNESELNIARLGIVGCELGASLALKWSFHDWQFPPLFTGKQGQDVQALVLISPSYNLKGVQIRNELAELQRTLPIQFVAGKKEPKAFGEAEKMHQAGVKLRPSDTKSQLTGANTKMQGGSLLNPELELEPDLNRAIVKFFDSTLKTNPSKWETREVGEGDRVVTK